MTKSLLTKFILSTLGLVVLGLSNAHAEKDWTKDMRNLGGNDKIIQRAQAIHSAQKVRIVQNRAVDRRMRLELGGQFGGVAGGDSYLSVRDMGAFAEFHISPRWSLGARYVQHASKLTNEGDITYNRAKEDYSHGRSFTVPLVDDPTHSVLGMISFFPLYGKVNLFDRGVTQFDFYITAGGGQVNLRSSGAQPTYTAGGGIAFWVSQYISTRLEVRWQTYNDATAMGGTESRRLDLGVATASLGVLL